MIQAEYFPIFEFELLTEVTKKFVGSDFSEDMLYFSARVVKKNNSIAVAPKVNMKSCLSLL